MAELMGGRASARGVVQTGGSLTRDELVRKAEALVAQNPGSKISKITATGVQLAVKVEGAVSHVAMNTDAINPWVMLGTVRGVTQAGGRRE